MIDACAQEQLDNSANSKFVMKCALCLSTSDLRNSHIIPEFQYKPIYDEKHRALVISSDPKERERFVQKGMREKLFCEQCEKRFSKWEDYACRVLFGDKAKILSRTTKVINLEGIDYPKFKLFLLSLLWRMSVAKGDFWKEVRLGILEEKLRQCLLNEDPLSSDDYPCLLVPILLDGTFETGWLCPPDRIRVKGHILYRVIINGILFCFFASTHASRFNFGQYAVNEHGNLRLSIDEAGHMLYVADMISAMGKAIRQRGGV